VESYHYEEWGILDQKLIGDPEPASILSYNFSDFYQGKTISAVYLPLVKQFNEKKGEVSSHHLLTNKSIVAACLTSFFFCATVPFVQGQETFDSESEEIFKSSPSGEITW
jgi:hypothetical protein